MSESLTRALSSSTLQRGSGAKLKEVTVRHRDLQQNQNKAMAAFVSVLFMAQICELKMLLDIGKHGHRFYYLVLSLLIASTILLILLGIIVIYIGHLQIRPGGWIERLFQCLTCKCKTRKSKCCRKKTKRPTLVSVPIGVNSELDGHARDIPYADDVSSSSDDEDAGCCQWPEKEDGDDDLEDDVNGSCADAARARVSDAVVRILTSTNEIERLEQMIKHNPNSETMKESETETYFKDDLRRFKEELLAARKDREEAEAEVRHVESRRQKAMLLAEQREARMERKTFRKLARWQQVALYILYFIGIMNVLITAFGVSGKTH